MNVAINRFQNSVSANDLVKDLYEKYAKKLLGYTLKNYLIGEDDAWNLVYKTIYRMAEIHDRYHFENEKKKIAFLFKTHINYLRNYYRDNKSFEHKNQEVKLREEMAAITNEDLQVPESRQLTCLQNQLDRLEEWERILLLMRGQEVPYSEIARFVNKPEKQLKVYYARLKKQLLEQMNDALQPLNELKNGKK
jgi:RNA polymerase sigma factor (sigma-70 family)